MAVRNRDVGCDARIEEAAAQRLNLAKAPDTRTGSATTACPAFFANAVRSNQSPWSMVFGIGMQTSARHAPCGLTANPFTRGRSRLPIHNDDASSGSWRIVVNDVARSSNSTVAVIGFCVVAFAIQG